MERETGLEPATSALGNRSSFENTGFSDLAFTAGTLRRWQARSFSRLAPRVFLMEPFWSHAPRVPLDRVERCDHLPAPRNTSTSSQRLSYISHCGIEDRRWEGLNAPNGLWLATLGLAAGVTGMVMPRVCPRTWRRCASRNSPWKGVGGTRRAGAALRADRHTNSEMIVKMMAYSI